MGRLRSLCPATSTAGPPARNSPAASWRKRTLTIALRSAGLDQDGHIDERPMVEDDRDVLFASVGCATDDDGLARVCRL